MDDQDGFLYEPFERLVDIEIEGKRFQVPENNLLLRCVQYLVESDVILGRFCWNDECGNCELNYRAPAQQASVRARGCQTVVEPGMSLSDLAPDLRYWLRDKLK